MSQTQSHISNISCIFQEICDIKSSRKPKSIVRANNYTSTSMDEGNKTNLNCTQELNSKSSAKEDSNGGDSLGDTYFSGSTQYHHEPNNPDNPLLMACAIRGEGNT